MKYNIIYITLVLACFCRCTSANKASDEKSGSKSQDTKVYSLNIPDTKNRSLDVSYFADTIIYVFLETNDDCLLRDLRQVLVSDSVLFISDIQNNFYKFNINGKFIKQIGSKGEGPMEYKSLRRFHIFNDSIYINDPFGKMLIYSMDGEFGRSVRLKRNITDFNDIDGYIAGYDYHHGLVCFYDGDMSLIDSIKVEYNVSEMRKYYSFNMIEHFRKPNDELYFNDLKNDTIWKISYKKKEPAFILNQKDKLLPHDKQIEYFRDMDLFYKEAESYRQYVLFPFSSYLFIAERNWRGGGVQYCITDLKENKTQRFYSLHDDLVSGGLYLFPFISTSQSDYLVTVLPNSATFSEMRDFIQFPQFKELTKHINDDDNPIIALIKVN